MLGEKSESDGTANPYTDTGFLVIKYVVAPSSFFLAV